MVHRRLTFTHECPFEYSSHLEPMYTAFEAFKASEERFYDIDIQRDLLDMLFEVVPPFFSYFEMICFTLNDANLRPIFEILKTLQ